MAEEQKTVRDKNRSVYVRTLISSDILTDEKGLKGHKNILRVIETETVRSAKITVATATAKVMDGLRLAVGVKVKSISLKVGSRSEVAPQKVFHTIITENVLFRLLKRDCIAIAQKTVW